MALGDAGHPMDDVMLKTYFLSNITDNEYKSIITLCRSNDAMGYEETVHALRSEAKSLGKLENRRPKNRKSNSK